MHAPEHFTILSSAARTAAVSSADYVNHGHRGVRLIIDVTADPGTAAVTFTIQGKNPTGGDYYTILASAALADVGVTTLTVYPGIAATANVSVSDVLPAEWRLNVTVADAESLTYSVGCDLLA